jgi:hypothetical protein
MGGPSNEKALRNAKQSLLKCNASSGGSTHFAEVGRSVEIVALKLRT